MTLLINFAYFFITNLWNLVIKTINTKKSLHKQNELKFQKLLAKNSLISCIVLKPLSDAFYLLHIIITNNSHWSKNLLPNIILLEKYNGDNKINIYI